MKKYDAIIAEITTIREHNNKLWMSLLKTALDLAPTRTRKTLAAITKNDQKVSQLTKKLAK